jgi:hypothetical protein
MADEEEGDILWIVAHGLDNILTNNQHGVFFQENYRNYIANINLEVIDMAAISGAETVSNCRSLVLVSNVTANHDRGQTQRGHLRSGTWLAVRTACNALRLEQNQQHRRGRGI